MGRIRTIKPEFFRSRSLARCSVPARLTFQGLWCEADDNGRGVADARLIKGAIWPLDDDVDTESIDAHLGELERTGHVRIYRVADENFYEIHSWEKHQAAAYRRGEGIHPEPDADQGECDDRTEIVQENADSCKEVLSRKGRERKGSADQSATPFIDGFAEIWNVYPRKLDRGKALRAYTARRRAGVSHVVLLAATTHYANSVRGADPKFIKYGATFFGPDEPFADYANGPPETTRVPGATQWVEPDVARHP